MNLYYIVVTSDYVNYCFMLMVSFLVCQGGASS